MTNGLIILGKIESGVEKFSGIKDDFTVKVEKIDRNLISKTHAETVVRLIKKCKCKKKIRLDS